MPEKILELLETESLTEYQIAVKLNISLDEVKACIEYLCQAGFIKFSLLNPMENGCSGNCGKCTSSCEANPQSVSTSAFKVWEMIT